MSEGPRGQLPPPLSQPLPRTIEGPRVTLRAHEVDAASALGELVMSNLDHLSILPFAEREPLTLDERRAMIEEWELTRLAGRDCVYGIWRGDQLIGSCGLHRRLPDPAALEIGYWIDVAHEGQGFVRESVLLLTETAFTFEEIDVAVICFDVQNDRSRAVATSCGFETVRTVEMAQEFRTAAASGREDVTEMRRAAFDVAWRDETG